MIKECRILRSGVVRRPLHGCVTAGWVPAGGLEFTGKSVALQVVKQASSLVGKLEDVIREVVGGSEMAYHVVPPMSPKKISRVTNMLT